MKWLWHTTPVSKYDFYFLLFLLGLTMCAVLFPDYPLTAITFKNLPIFTLPAYGVVSMLLIVALAWRRWIGVIRLVFLLPAILYTFTVILYALPVVGKPPDYIITVVLLGWMIMFVRK